MNNKYSNKIELNRRKIIYNKNNTYFNENNNYFLNGENLELPTFQKNNYQNIFINRKHFTSNSKNNKNKYNNFKYSNHKENKIKENNYYSNNANVSNNMENYDSLTEKFENMKQMNSNINSILSKMQKEIQSSSNKKEQMQKTEEDGNINYDKFSNKNYNNEYEQNNILDNELEDIKFNYNLDYYQQQNNKNIINNNKSINNPKNILIIDKNEENQINIQGIKPEKDPFNIETDEFKTEQENKLNSIYGKNKNKIINVDKLINDLYEYKIKNEKLQMILNSKSIEKTKKEINENLSKLKDENIKLNLQKRFLINELTKSVYNRENLRHKYKNELDRVDSYLNKIKYELKENKFDSA